MLFYFAGGGRHENSLALSACITDRTNDNKRSPDTDVLVLILKYAQNIEPIVCLILERVTNEDCLTLSKLLKLKGLFRAWLFLP